MLTLDQIRGLPVIGDCFAAVDRQWPDLAPQRLRHEALRRGFGRMVEDVLHESAARLERLGAESMAEVQAAPTPVVAFTDEMAANLAAIKAFLFENMYRHYRVKRMRQKAIRVVRELFEIFMNDPGVLPDEWREDARSAEDETLRARIIADYIAGMTDRFALEEHRVLTDPFSRA